MTEEKTQKPGPKWTNDHYYTSHEDASIRIKELLSKWAEIKEDNMQTKIRRRNDGRFLVKYRKDPAFSPKEKKNGNSNRKNKRNSGNGKFNAEGSV